MDTTVVRGVGVWALHSEQQDAEVCQALARIWLACYANGISGEELLEVRKVGGGGCSLTRTPASEGCQSST